MSTHRHARSLLVALTLLSLGGAMGSASCGSLRFLVPHAVESQAPGVPPTRVVPSDVAGGDPTRGSNALRAYGCGACHVIPGVVGAQGQVGPPLTQWALRAYIAGNLPNIPPNLVRWIRDPQAIEPGTAMPSLGVSEAEARDMAAYLYTLR